MYTPLYFTTKVSRSKIVGVSDPPDMEKARK